jgi:hypothetical protein
MSLFGLVVMGFAPVGSIIYGITAHYTGPGPTIAGGSLLAALAAGFVLLRYPDLRHLDFTDLGPPEAKPESEPLPPNVSAFRG